MSRDSFVVRNRAEFDDFWISGIRLGKIQPLITFEPSSDGITFQAASEDETQAASASIEPPHLPASPVDDAPITAQVWWAYATRELGSPVDLLVDPSAIPVREGMPPRSNPTALQVITKHMIDRRVSLASTQLGEQYGVIAMALTFEVMVTRLLPLTSWCDFLTEAKDMEGDQRLDAMRAYYSLEHRRSNLGRVGWFLHLLAICGHRTSSGEPAEITYGRSSRALQTINRLLRRTQIPTIRQPVGRVTLNRPVRAAVNRSQRTVKVDATRGLFGIRCDNIRWAVVDTGIDARHRWFRAVNPDGTPFVDAFENNGVTFNYTRILGAYDFAVQRTSGTLTARGRRGERAHDSTTASPPLRASTTEAAARVRRTPELTGDIPIALELGEQWYVPPANGHGTHVAGIIGGSGGLCPDIRLYDYRVLDAEGHGNEFAVVAALRHILDTTQRAARANPAGRSRDIPIHGVNLSLALDSDVTSDACGWSLVCRVCDELVRAGVVVVVSAGNSGFADPTGTVRSTGQQYHTISVADPGNTERVITVGSTDADRPREYGVSYFSARGPTADGRQKPDLVAPGDSITSAYGYRRGDDEERDVFATLSGTSQAAAHVSACAALLMARHRELIGKPDEVKRILLATATDLARDRNFQGAGLVDALRAVQSI
jgi:hypothetical protein